MEFEEFIREWRGVAPYIVAKTSGSTGEPKIIHLDKEFVKQSAERTNRYFGIGIKSRLHSCVAADYIGGKMMAVRGEIVGCRMTWEPPSNRPLSNVGKEETIDLLAIVPSQIIHILDNRGDMPEIKAVIIGGSAIDPSLYQRICESGVNAYETYGMTETSSHIALRKITKENEWFETLEGITVATDNRSCLVIHFDSGQCFHTNDLAEIKDDKHFKIKGRFDLIIITGGKKVNPYDVEKKLAPYISTPFIITSKPDYKWGSAVVLRIEDRRCDKINEEHLRAIMKELLPEHEMPKFIDIVSCLPRTKNGKIRR